MKKMFILFFLIISTPLFLHAQIEKNSKKEQSPVRAKFFQDFLNFSSGNVNETRLDVFIQVPYTEIQFVKSNTGFTANYMVTITVYDENKEKIITEKLWNEKVDAKDFEQSISKNNFNLSLRSFNLRPAKYQLRTSVEDKESKKKLCI